MVPIGLEAVQQSLAAIACDPTQDSRQTKIHFRTVAVIGNLERDSGMTSP